MFVLDASITLRWFFEAGTHPRADTILGLLKNLSDTAIVPTIWQYEVSSVVARAQSKGSASAQEVTDFLDDLEHLPIFTDRDAKIFADVHVVATANRLTTYDAAYLELAQRKQLPLATLDAELIVACKNVGVPLL